MKLIIMRHGDARAGSDDDRRPLSDAGIAEAERAGEALRLAGASPALICHSELLRARQTAEIVAARLGLAQNLLERRGLRPGDSAARFAAELTEIAGDAPGVGDLLVVGHLPFVAELASCLLSGSESAVAVRFATGTLLCLEREGRGCWVQRWHLPAGLAAKILGCRETSG